MELFRQVCEAVQHAHERGVIHRDLKPSNILVKKDGAVRLLDFGVAKQLDAETSLTATGVAPVPMTLAYAAPEQVSKGLSGTHTDIYSLGATLYELLTGKPPFNLERMTPAAVEAAISHRDPKRPSSLSAEGHAKGGDWRDLDLLCLTAMHKDPARRYRSADALIRDVNHWLAHQPLDTRQASAWYRLTKLADATGGLWGWRRRWGRSLWVLQFGLHGPSQTPAMKRCGTRRPQNAWSSLYSRFSKTATPVLDSRRTRPRLTYWSGAEKRRRLCSTSRSFKQSYFPCWAAFIRSWGSSIPPIDCSPRLVPG